MSDDSESSCPLTQKDYLPPIQKHYIHCKIQRERERFLLSVHKGDVTRPCPLQKNFPANCLCNIFGGGGCETNKSELAISSKMTDFTTPGDTPFRLPKDPRMAQKYFFKNAPRPEVTQCTFERPRRIQKTTGKGGPKMQGQKKETKVPRSKETKLRATSWNVNRSLLQETVFQFHLATGPFVKRT